MRKREITAQIIEQRMRRVVQAVEPEAKELLIEKGGSIRPSEEHLYEEYLVCYWPTLVLYWPADTLSAYVSPRGQEDGVVIFAIFLLPDSTQELHIVYDYRLSSPHGPFEEYLTLRVAQEHEYVLRALLRKASTRRC